MPAVRLLAPTAGVMPSNRSPAIKAAVDMAGEMLRRIALFDSVDTGIEYLLWNPKNCTGDGGTALTLIGL